MSRGVKDILVENCTFIGTDVGVRMKSALGRGGVVENITIRNIDMVNIRVRQLYLLWVMYSTCLTVMKQ